MPRFTVIVPAHRVQGFLRQCLDSVLGQSFTDWELIAVDDRSPDRSGEILDSYAARDPRITVLHLPENAGLGRARNAALPHATGDHLLFLDSDDTLTPGALRAIADRLDETGDPDVLVFDYVRAHWWGGVRRNALAHVLARTRAVPGGAFTAAEHPEILELLMVVWNKAYRREFVERHGFRFPPGYYEDTPWTFPVLLTAARIASLDRVCLNYRQRPTGSILSTTSRKHFDLHEQYRRVFAFLDERPELAHWKPYLHRKAGEHCLDVLGKPDRLPPSAKGEFFRATARLLREHRPPGAWTDAAPRVLRLPYAAYLLGRKASAARHRAGAAAARLRAVAARRGDRIRQFAHRRRALDGELALYSAFHHRGVLGDPAAIHRAALEYAPHIRGVWVVRPEHAGQVPEGVEHVAPGSPRHLALQARATWFVNDVNWPWMPVKRPGSVHIHTHRGTPLRYQGADLLTKPGARRGLDVPRMLRRADRWDHSLVANRHSERVWDRAFPCHFTSRRTGSPRNDVLVRGDTARGAAARARLGIPAGHTVVLYAPARRDHTRGGHVEPFDPARFAADLGPGRTLVVRLHPSLADGPARGLGLAELHRRGVLVDATDEPHVEDLMLASDVLVTDHSSLMFDYANLDRPIVVHADDLPAVAASRGLYLDITAEPPGHVTRAYEELAALFASDTWRDEESARLRARFRAVYNEFDDGRAAERVVRTLMLGEPMPAATGGSGPAGTTAALPAPATGRDDLQRLS
ncbi:bifunctional glycosyltransferase/CDP-glycerol:glycerophosphate glycerophosphotransferase [Streptomyces abyssomicinicus]|uniref:bifunctional glycosyltransferase/CDP-glycerol:glycerophosphate glycerophosphotransferase n=1 Tax=Streptomyces abyssomicinicus TaxID=574929 RepID=UPI00125073D8|nr:bifunctional glycosyltransferase/CDP-glycerol:glycerophosphate glycerophosphotransferase [Streptomyces abyssomicinicus]